MKILVIHEVNYLEKIIYEYQILPEMFSMFGHEVTVVDYDENWASRTALPTFDLRTRIHVNVSRAYPAGPVTVRRPGMIRLPIISRLSSAVTAGLEINRVIRDQHVDAILLYGLPTIGIQTLASARRYNVPVFFRSIDVLNQLVPAALRGMTRALERIVFNNVDLVMALTPALQHHVESYGVPHSRTTVLPCGVDTNIFHSGPRNQELAQRWNIGSDDPVILFMGTIYRFSGLDRIIRDLPFLLALHPTAKLLLVGHGELEDELKALVRSMSLEKNVIFAGLQPYSILPDIVRLSTVCINPFHLNAITRDILPTKLFQYMACGKPLLATRLPGVAPFLSGEEQGVMYLELDEFVTKMTTLLSNPARIAELGERAERTARQDYDWKRLAEKMLQCMRLS